MVSDTAARKAQLRAEIRTRRAQRPETQRTAEAAGLAAQLSQLVRDSGARTVTAYVPLAHEPDTGPFLDWCTRARVRVLLPVSLPEHLLGWLPLDEQHGRSALRPGRHGILEPEGHALPAAAAAQADLLLIPASAVGFDGSRLGWGRGYYDRLLEHLTPRPPVFAVVFDDEVLPAAPREAHDALIDGAVTPAEIYRFAREASARASDGQHE